MGVLRHTVTGREGGGMGTRYHYPAEWLCASPRGRFLVAGHREFARDLVAAAAPATAAKKPAKPAAQK